MRKKKSQIGRLTIDDFILMILFHQYTLHGARAVRSCSSQHKISSRMDKKQILAENRGGNYNQIQLNALQRSVFFTFYSSLPQLTQF